MSAGAFAAERSVRGRPPFFAADGIVLFRGDVLAVLRELPTASAQACLTDPPYGEGVASWDGPRCREWYVAWLRELNRVVVPGGPILAFSSRRRIDVFMTALREVRGDESECPLQTMAWQHRQGFRPAVGYLRPEHEAIVISGLVRSALDEVRAARQALERRATTCPSCGTTTERTGTGHPIGPVAGTIIYLPRRKKRADRTGHPTQKPEPLVRYLVALVTEPGATVIDPFAGSGTTLAAARAIGRSAVGIERSLRTCRIASRRLTGDGR